MGSRDLGLQLPTPPRAASKEANGTAFGFYPREEDGVGLAHTQKARLKP